MSTHLPAAVFRPPALNFSLLPHIPPPRIVIPPVIPPHTYQLPPFIITPPPPIVFNLPPLLPPLNVPIIPVLQQNLLIPTNPDPWWKPLLFALAIIVAVGALLGASMGHSYALLGLIPAAAILWFSQSDNRQPPQQAHHLALQNLPQGRFGTILRA